MTTEATAQTGAPVTEAADTPNPNMTGEEAKAWVEAQKAKEQGGSSIAGRSAQAQPKQESTQDMIKEAAKTVADRRKVKINGVEEEVDVDQVIRDYQKYKGSESKFQEAYALRKQAEEFISMMKDPEKFFEAAKKLGHDPRGLTEKYLAAQLEEELLDPREKELRETKRQLRAMEELEANRKKQIEAQRDAALKAKYREDYNNQFVEALQNAKLPPTKPMVAEMAKYISRAARLGFEMTPNEAAQLVEEDIKLAHTRLLGEADGETLIKLLGENVANKVRKWDTSRVKNPEQFLKSPDHMSEAPRVRAPSKKRMTPSEWRQYNRR